MGKTVPTYHMALEDEICQWKSFRKSLSSEEERQAFDIVMDLARSNAMAASNACKPILFELLVMSVLLGQQKMIRTLQRKIDALLLATLPIEKAE